MNDLPNGKYVDPPKNITPFQKHIKLRAPKKRKRLKERKLLPFKKNKRNFNNFIQDMKCVG